jgi:hypothetical protein
MNMLQPKNSKDGKVKMKVKTKVKVKRKRGGGPNAKTETVNPSKADCKWRKCVSRFLARV